MTDKPETELDFLEELALEAPELAELAREELPALLPNEPVPPGPRAAVR